MKTLLMWTGLALLAPACAGAQVVVNQLALQQLAGVVAPPPAPPASPAPVVVLVKPAHHRHAIPGRAVPLHLLYSPPPLMPAPPPAPKPSAPVPVVAKPILPVRLPFADGSAALPSAAALKPWCTAPGRIAISAYAPANRSDPSAALRLSLARALAVQSALTACGVPPANILPRALGSAPGGGPNDVLIGAAP